MLDRPPLSQSRCRRRRRRSGSSSTTSPPPPTATAAVRSSPASPPNAECTDDVPSAPAGGGEATELLADSLPSPRKLAQTPQPPPLQQRRRSQLPRQRPRRPCAAPPSHVRQDRWRCPPRSHRSRPPPTRGRRVSPPAPRSQRATLPATKVVLPTGAPTTRGVAVAATAHGAEAATTSAGAEEESGGCEHYRVDLSAANFGDCVCGRPRNAHSERVRRKGRAGVERGAGIATASPLPSPCAARDNAAASPTAPRASSRPTSSPLVI